MSVTVYTRNNCPFCDRTKEMLADLGVDFDVVNIEEDPAGLDKLIELGYQGVPVVVTKDDNWVGFQPSKLMKLKGE
jgi:glutaredoxin-like protein NrdH